MWHTASLTVKRLLAAAEAPQIDNIVVTHQGPAWATFITTTRALLLGKRDKLWGVFPPAGLAAEQSRLAGASLGTCIASQLPVAGRQREQLVKRRGQRAVELNRRYVLPELVGWFGFSAWARLLRFLKRRAPWAFNPGICGFMPLSC